MNIEHGIFGRINDQEIEYYKISNDKGEHVKILTLGGIINELYITDKSGKQRDIICGYDAPEKYLGAAGYQGALIGRYSNRINKAEFTLDGETYKLFKKPGHEHTLHGGKIGFDKKIWSALPFDNITSAGVILSYISEDGEEGYPGNLKVRVTYTFTESSEFSINYYAVTDAATPVNLTNHAYFNLNGYDGGSVMDHTLFIDADSYIEVDDKEQIPLPGAPTNVTGTDFDFTSPRKIRIGYDHNFCFGSYNGMIKKRAEAYSDKSGIKLTMLTNKPAVQLYTACVMNDPTDFKGGVKQIPLSAFCLETQFYPDSPNRLDYPSSVLRPGEIYDYTTIFKFEAVK